MEELWTFGAWDKKGKEEDSDGVRGTQVESKKKLEKPSADPVGEFVPADSRLGFLL